MGNLDLPIAAGGARISGEPLCGALYPTWL